MIFLRNAEKIAEYKKVFLSFDKENECKITIHSLKTILEQMCGTHNDPSQYWTKIMRAIRIDFNTFLTYLAMYESDNESPVLSDEEENTGKNGLLTLLDLTHEQVVHGSIE